MLREKLLECYIRRLDYYNRNWGVVACLIHTGDTLVVIDADVLLHHEITR